MANQVFANNMEVSCKSASGKSIACFPDVCFTPPQAPPTPPGVPIPYPNTGMASDTTNGTRTIKITGKEAMLKNKSYFKTSTGDEAGCAPKKGVVTSKIKGKVYYTAWSMDVKFEGENVVRHMDLMTHNHASMPGNTPTWPYLDEMAVSKEEGPCKDDIKKEKEACKEFTPHKADGPSPCPPDGKPSTKDEADAYADKTAAKECLRARRCQLSPYAPTGKQPGCCPGQTGHHVVEAGSFYNVGRGGSNSTAIEGTANYNADKAPCICVEGCNQYHGTHGLMHTYQSTAALNSGATTQALPLEGGKQTSVVSLTYKQAKTFGVDAVGKSFPESKCEPACLEAQLDAYHNKQGIDDSTQCRSIATGYKGDEAEKAANAAVVARSSRLAAASASAPSGR
ncbi:type VI secretion system effector Dnase Tse7 [Pseudomonas sp. No.21]|jgi:hypothetical protein|nr:MULTISPECIES: PAAR-like domain-containing protein [Pseudomonas]MDW3715402.1 PAAR-like domain-containing protein [Pseudomonas sp. 2023EL-01195]GJN45525.1 hypothetical protein TUM20249_15110 [Pseudomonas tohonis]